MRYNILPLSYPFHTFFQYFIFAVFDSVNCWLYNYVYFWYKIYP